MQQKRVEVLTHANHRPPLPHAAPFSTRVKPFLPFINTPFPMHKAMFFLRQSTTNDGRKAARAMSDRSRDRQRSEAMKGFRSENGPTGSQALAVATLLPIGGGLLALAGLTLVGSLVGLAVLTPLFLLFSPVLVPAALLAAMAIGWFLTSGAFGLAGLSSLGYLLKQARGWAQSTAPEQIECAKRRVGEAARQGGQKARETGQDVQSRAVETKRT